MTRADIEAGKAFVRLTLKNELAKGLAEAQRQVKRFAGQVNDTGKTLAGFGAAITGPLLGAAYHFAQTGDQLDKMSARTGVAVEELSALKFAAEQSGASLEDVGKAMLKMQQNGFDPKTFDAVASEIAAIEDPTKRAQRAMEVFGKSGLSILPMLGDIKELRAEAEELGLVMSTEQAQSAAELTDAINRTRHYMAAFAREIGGAVAPELKKLAAWIRDIIPPAKEWIERNRETIVLMLKIGGVVAATGAGLMLLGKVILGVSAALGALKTAILLTSKVSMLLYANPVLLGLAAVAAAVTVIAIAYQRAEAAARAKVRAAQQAAAASQREHEAGQQMRAADIERMKRLEQLAEHQRRFGSLTKSQTEEAAGLVGTLNGSYKGLGLTFDETTGKVGGLTGAMGEMVDAMREMAALSHQKVIDDLRKESAAYQAEAERIAGQRMSVVGWALAVDEDQVQQHKAVLEKWAATEKKIVDEMRKNRRIREGTGDVSAGGAERGEEADTIEALAKHREDVEKRLLAAALARIEDTQTRELSAAKVKYQQERDALRDLFKDDQEFELALADLKKATEAELDNIRARYRKQREAEEQRAAEADFEARRRFAERQAAEEKRRAQQAASEAEDLQKQIARQTVELQLKDDPQVQRRALLELEHRWQMEAIEARKDLTEEERKNMLAMQEHLHDLRQEALDAGRGAVAGRPGGMGDITGHSAARAAAIAYGTTQGPQEKMAAGIDRMADQLDDVVEAAKDQTRAVEDWSAAIRQWLAGLSYA